MPCSEGAETWLLDMFQFDLVQVLQPVGQAAGWAEAPAFPVPCPLCAVS